MPYSKAIQVLVDEHEAMLMVLDALEHAACDLGRKFDRQFYLDVADFCGVFADKCHHAKEERMLFPALEAAGLKPGEGPMRVMLSDHVQARAHMKAIRDAIPAAAEGDAAAYETIRREALAYVELLRTHIQNENLVLFAMSERLLDAATKARLYQQFQAELGAEHEKYRTLAESLCRRAREVERVCSLCS